MVQPFKAVTFGNIIGNIYGDVLDIQNGEVNSTVHSKNVGSYSTCLRYTYFIESDPDPVALTG